MPDDRPNVLWIYGEDLGPQLSCYGETAIKTPNMDRLAAEGTRFTNAFVTCPVCSPSRSALITGRYQTSFGAHHHRSCRDKPLKRGVRLITDYFRDAGYFTCNSGGPPFDQAGKQDFNFKRANAFDGIDWSERPKGKPFYAQCNLKPTHRMQRFARGHADSPPDPATVHLPAEYPDHPLTRRDWALYLDSVAREDAEVGAILDRLDAEGLDENTIVIMMSDHGPGHPRHKQFCYDGGLRIPLIIRWPKHIEAGAVRDDLISGVDLAPTSLALAGVKVPRGMEGQVFLGEKAAPPREHIIAARDRCDGTIDRIRAVRTSRYKYIRNYHPERAWTQFNAYKEGFYPTLHLMRALRDQGRLTRARAHFLDDARPTHELYDLEADPAELHNIAGKPHVAGVLRDMKRTLDDWIKATGDLGAEPEDPDVIDREIDHMAEWHGKLLEERGLPDDADNRTQLAWWDHWIAKAGGWQPLGTWD